MLKLTEQYCALLQQVADFKVVTAYKGDLYNV
jgi:hypothetical protein